MRCPRLFALVVLSLSMMPPAIIAQVTPQEQYSKIANGGETISAVDGGAFGETIDLSTGGVEFSTTDVSIPGNSGLPVSFGRRRNIEVGRTSSYYLGDWDIDVPFVEGIYATGQGWVIQGFSEADSPMRCANANGVAAARPGVVTRGSAPAILSFQAQDYWQGNHLQTPGAGRQELLVNNLGISQPPQGGPFKFVTSGHWFFECEALASGGAGDAFKARSPDGLIYTLNYMVTTTAPSLLWPRSNGGNYELTRERVRLYATRVEDRFGNWVNYNWSNGLLNTIEANDGRKITITHQNSPKGGPRVVQVVAHTTTTLSDHPSARIWQYGYSTDNGWSRLISVTQPNGSAWTLDFSSINRGAINYEAIGQNNVGWDTSLACNWMRQFSTTMSNEKTAILTHPSGATATFTLEPKRHGRTSVDRGVCSDPTGNPANNTPERPARFDVWSITKKQISGPGLPAVSTAGEYKWTYGYNLPVGNFCPTTPGCPPNPGPDEKTVSILAPDSSTTTYTYGIRYGGNDGQLLAVSTTSGGTPLRTESYQYVTDPTAYSMPARIGTTPQPHGDSHFGEIPRPQRVRTISQNNVDFTKTIVTFDYWGNPKQVTKSSTPGSSKTETTTYRPPTDYWILGLVTERETTPGNVSPDPELEITYNTDALPSVVRSFGRTTQTASYHPDGTLHYLYDGNSNYTRFQNYHRGIAESVGYPNSETQSAEVNDFGQITSITDELQNPTTYHYIQGDGRLERIVYPAGDSPASNDRVFTFAPASASSIGINASLWQQTVTQGSAIKRTYFDALLRPILTYEEDTNSQAPSARYTRKEFDFAGREKLVTYPVSTIGGNLFGVSAGTRSTYDGLGRLAVTSQDAEPAHGTLTTQVFYESGFKKRVQNARGISTTTSFKTFDEPVEDWPAFIDAPETADIEIERDVFGKPLQIERSGTHLNDGTAFPVSAIRHYYYDVNEQLCKTVDPELGATIMEYDGAGNVTYSGQGLNLTTSNCDRAHSSYTAVRTQQTYDTRNRLNDTIYADGSPSILRDYYADGALRTLTTSDPTTATPIIWGYQYNHRRLLTDEAITFEGRNYVLQNQYSPNGHLRKLVYPDALEIDYAPNALGEPTQAGNALKMYASGVSTYATGAIHAFTYGNGITHSLTQNTRKLPLRSLDSGGVLDDTYAYDKNANVASIADAVSGATRAMTYDDLDRLESMSASLPWSTSSFKYDAIDNIRWSTVGSRSYQHVYNGQNQIQSLNVGATPSIGYVHERGNITQRGDQTFVFDRGNRIVSTGGSVPAKSETYAYDGHGRRVKVFNWGTGAKRLMVYSQTGQLRFELDEAQAKVIDYVYLGGSLIAREESTTIEIPTEVPVVTAPPTNSTGTYVVSWTSSARATNYKLEEQKDAGGWVEVCNTSALSCELALRSNGTYLYKARACNSAGCSDAGKARQTVVSGVIPPPAPSGIVANPNPSHTGNFEIRWAMVGGATQYQLEGKPAGSSTWVPFPLSSANSRQISAKTVGQHQYRVSACSSACGPSTSPVTVTVNENLGVLVAPTWTNPPGTNTTGTFTLSWSNVSGRTSYQLQELAPGAWTWANQTLSPVTTQSKSLTRANGTYSYQVRTCNAAGCGDYGPVLTVVVSIPAPINPPSPFTVTPGISTNGEADLDWGDVAGTTYELQRNFEGGGWSDIYSGAASDYEDANLLTGNYEYRVRACSISQCSGYAGPIQLAVNRPGVAPPEVAWITATPVNSADGSYTLTWAPSLGSTHYYVEETIGGGEVNYYHHPATAQNPETRNFINRGNGSYVYKIRACKTGAAPTCSLHGAATASVLVQIPSGIASPAWIQGPSGCKKLGGGESHTFIISWASVAGATRYQVYEGDDLNGVYPNNPIVTTPTSNPNLQTLSLTRDKSGNPSITYNYGVRACNATTCSEERRTAYMCFIPPSGSEEEGTTTAVRYIHTDALGSPVAETTDVQPPVVVKRNRYEPYGAPTDGVYVNGPGFTGHVTDAATGLTYMQQRYYDPMAGRFLSLDPVVTDTANAANFNRYRYGSNNPFKFIDPDGRLDLDARSTYWSQAHWRADAVKVEVDNALAESLKEGMRDVEVKGALVGKPDLSLAEGAARGSGFQVSKGIVNAEDEVKFVTVANGQYIAAESTILSVTYDGEAANSPLGVESGLDIASYKRAGLSFSFSYTPPDKYQISLKGGIGLGTMFSVYGIMWSPDEGGE
jgi:RHS repeat-associated protein